MKLVVNRCYGGFGISKKCAERMSELGSAEAQKLLDRNEWFGFLRNTPRHDPILVQAVEELGDEASGSCAELVVINIPDDVDYEISDYDGIETVHERHRSW